MSKELELKGWVKVGADKWEHDNYPQEVASLKIASIIEQLKDDRKISKAELKKYKFDFKKKTEAIRFYKNQRKEILSMVNQSIIYTQSGDPGRSKRMLMTALNLTQNAD